MKLYIPTSTCVVPRVKWVPIACSSSGGGGSGPPPLAGYTAWYDASQITGQANGSALSTWPDLSGSGNTLTQATPASQPLYYNSTPANLINGKPTVFFDGSQAPPPKFLATAPINVVTSASLWVFAVCQSNSRGSYGALFTHTNGNTGAPWDYYLTTSTGIPDLILATTSFNGNTAPSLNTPHLIEYGYDGSINNAYHYLDRVANGGPSFIGSASGGSYPFILGSRQDSATSWWGLIAEVIYYPFFPALSDRQNVENYLRTKWATP